MARAYDHMPRFPRLVCFINQCKHELEEERGELEAALRMWKETADLIFDRVFVEERVAETKSRLSAIAYEYAHWGTIKARLPICKKCGGYGEITTGIDQDESETHKCSACSGTGINGDR